MFDASRIFYLGKKSESKNVISKIPSKNSNSNKPLIVFSAHYDSISLRFSFKQTIILYGTGGLAFLAYLCLTFVISIWALLFLLGFVLITAEYFLLRNVAFILGIGIAIIIVVILFNKRTNESTGAIDNASGVSILIELAKLVKKQPLENLDVIFLWCGAEEWGLWGSKQFLANHFNNLTRDYNLDKSYNINIDMVGTYIGLVDKTGLIKKKQMNANLNDVLLAEAKQLNVPITKSNIPIGAGSDHMTFRAFVKKAKINNFQVSCFLSNKDGKFVHSAKDTTEKCSSKNLNGCLNVCYNTIKSLDLRV